MANELKREPNRLTCSLFLTIHNALFSQMVNAPWSEILCYWFVFLMVVEPRCIDKWNYWISDITPEIKQVELLFSKQNTNLTDWMMALKFNALRINGNDDDSLVRFDETISIGLICTCLLCRLFQGILLMRVNCGAFDLWLTTLFLSTWIAAQIHWYVDWHNAQTNDFVIGIARSSVLCHEKCERGREQRMERSVFVVFTSFVWSIGCLVGRSIDRMIRNCFSIQLIFQEEQSIFQLLDSWWFGMISVRKIYINIEREKNNTFCKYMTR